MAATQPASPDTKPVISVVICTYNREDVLGYCLEYLENQTAPAETYEVIVVDNNCTDGSPAIISDCVERNPNFRCLRESRQGLSHARNTGYQNARADYVAYMDDDARAAPTWIETARGIIATFGPDVFGGPVTPYHTSPVPDWFRPEYGTRLHQETSGWMPKGTFVSAMNIVFKKDLLEEFGGFTIERGMTAEQLIYGDESEIITYAHNHGRRVYYSLDLSVEHHVPDYKKNIAFHIFQPYRMGRDANYFVEGRQFGFGDLASLPRDVEALMSAIGSGLRQRDLQRYPMIEDYIVEHVGPPANRVGGIVEHFLLNPVPPLDQVLQWYTVRKYPLRMKGLIRATVMLLKLWAKSVLARGKGATAPGQ